MFCNWVKRIKLVPKFNDPDIIKQIELLWIMLGHIEIRIFLVNFKG